MDNYYIELRVRAFFELMKKSGLVTAMEVALLDLGLLKKHVFNYPISSLTLKINKGPLSFWRRLELGYWEIDLIRFIHNLVKPGETILDIGAWIGPLTFLFSHLVEKTGKVYSFEPMLGSFRLLKEYIVENNVSNIYSYNMAISNKMNNITIYAPSQTSTLASAIIPNRLVKPIIKPSKYKIQQKCKCTTIDQFCINNNINPDGIKIDVEGMEYSVLEGAINTIEKYHPWCIFEFHGSFLSEFERQRIWSFITDRAEKIIYIEGDEDYLTYEMDVPFDFKPTKRSNYCIFFK